MTRSRGNDTEIGLSRAEALVFLDAAVESAREGPLGALMLGVEQLTALRGCVAHLAEPKGEPDAVAAMELSEWVQQVKDAIFYARVCARSHGYALAVHGTLRRDVDVVAVPWTGEACSADELAEHIVAYFISVGLCFESGAREHMQQSREQKPHGRLGYAIPLKGIPAPYLDLSIAPRAPQLSEPGGEDTKRLAIAMGNAAALLELLDCDEPEDEAERERLLKVLREEANRLYPVEQSLKDLGLPNTLDGSWKPDPRDAARRHSVGEPQ